MKLIEKSTVKITISILKRIYVRMNEYPSFLQTILLPCGKIKISIKQKAIE